MEEKYGTLLLLILYKLKPTLPLSVTRQSSTTKGVRASRAKNPLYTETSLAILLLCPTQFIASHRASPRRGRRNPLAIKSYRRRDESSRSQRNQCQQGSCGKAIIARAGEYLLAGPGRLALTDPYATTTFLRVCMALSLTYGLWTGAGGKGGIVTRLAE